MECIYIENQKVILFLKFIENGWMCAASTLIGDDCVQKGKARLFLEII